MVDEDGSGLISLQEFKQYFNVEEIDDLKKLEEKNKTWLKKLLVDIELAVYDSGKSAQYIFAYHKLRMKNKEFTERLKRIKFNSSKHPQFEKEFMQEIITHETKTNYVDLTKFQYLLEHYKTMTAA
jgi:hypothetical protein